MEHWYPKRRFGDLYDEAAARWPDREALVYLDRRYSFREAAAKVDEAARARSSASASAPASMSRSGSPIATSGCSSISRWRRSARSPCR